MAGTRNAPRRRRGQALFEFMLVATILAVYLVVYIAMFSGQNATTYYFTERVAAKAVADQVAFAANEAFIAGNGSVLAFTVPNYNNTVSVNASSVQVLQAKNLVHGELVDRQVGGNFSAGNRTVTNNADNLTFS